MFRRSPYVRPATDVRRPLRSEPTVARDPQVSSAIAKRILETLGEISKPFGVRPRSSLHLPPLLTFPCGA